MLSNTSFIRFIVAGQLKREYILTPDGRAHLDIPGGDLLYAAASLSMWDNDIGLLSRVGEDYPQDWINDLAEMGFECQGINILPQSLDLRYFAGYTGEDIKKNDNPIAHFSQLGIKFPKALLGYNPLSQIDSHTTPTQYTLQLSNIPNHYYDATAAHLCPLDFLSHHLIPARLQQGHISTITIDPSKNYMNPSFWRDVHILVKDITAFMPSEEEIITLFQGRSTDIWSMAEDLAAQGCEFIVIKQAEKGQLLYIHANHSKYEIPAYPVKVFDPTGAGSSFCGGFLAGYRLTYDPIEAVCYGNISASLTVEGTGPFFALNALPGLAEARLRKIKEMVRKI